MNVREHIDDWWRTGLAGAGSLRRRGQAWAGGAAHDGDNGLSDLTGGISRGLMGRSLELAEVQEEVAAETRGQVIIVGRSDAANRGLLSRLRQEDPLPAAGPVYREGFYTVVTLVQEPEDRGAPTDDWPLAAGALWWPEEIGGADVVLYVVDVGLGADAADARWHGRLRGLGAPLAAVLWAPGDTQADVAGLAALLHLPPAGRPVAVRDLPPPGDADVLALIDRLLELRPRLALALAQEAPCCRNLVARRVVRQSVLASTLLGVEPVPLLDLPLQVGLCWRMALQLAVVHGRPGLDYRSRELVAAVATTFSARLVAQQLVKLAPIIGWAASAGLSGLGAWLLGQTLLRYYNGLPALPRLQRREGAFHVW